MAHRPQEDGPWVLVSEGGYGSSRAAVAAVRARWPTRATDRPSRRTTAARSRVRLVRALVASPVPLVVGDGAEYAGGSAGGARDAAVRHDFFTTDAALLAVGAPVRTCSTRQRARELGRAAGLEAPPTQVFESGRELLNAGPQLTYPVIVKPALKFSAGARGRDGCRRARAASPEESSAACSCSPSIEDEFHGLGGVAYQGRLVATMHVRLPTPVAAAVRNRRRGRDRAARRRARSEVAVLLRNYDGPFHLDFVGSLPARREPADPRHASAGGTGRRQHRRDLLRSPAGASVPTVRVAAGTAISLDGRRPPERALERAARDGDELDARRTRPDAGPFTASPR